MSRIVAHKYEVVRTLGNGGTGAVLEARHLTLSNRRVALEHLPRPQRQGPNLLTLWHPWVVAAAHALVRDSELPLFDDERGALSAVVRWGLHELEAGVQLIATAPGYKLAEYLIAVSDLVPAK